jgi:hypothetical protein
MKRWNRVGGKFVNRYIYSNNQAIKNIYFEYFSVTFRLPFRYIRYLITHVIQTTKKVTLTIRSTTIAEKK